MFNTQSVDGSSELWSRSVELPKGTTKQWTAYYRPGLGYTDRELSFVMGANSKKIPYQVDSYGNDAVLIGVVGDAAVGINTLRESWRGRVPASTTTLTLDDGSRRTRVGLVSLSEMPDRPIGYRSLNWLVWPQADPSSILPEQLDAVLQWVATGGHLLITVSDSWRQVQGSKLGDALPIEFTDLEDVTSLKSLATSWGGQAITDVTIPVATGELKNDSKRQIWTLGNLDDGRAAWVAGTYGLGTVHVLTVDPQLDALTGAVGREKMWRRLLWLPPKDASSTWYGSLYSHYSANETLPTLEAIEATNRLNSTGFGVEGGIPAGLASALNILEPGFVGSRDTDTYYGSYTNINEAITSFLRDIPGVAPLPLSWLLVFSVVYLLLIGPIDYFVLKRLKRQPLTWITFPIYIVLFSSIALIGTSISKGSQAILNRVEVVTVLPGAGMWSGSSYNGLFVTGRTTVVAGAGHPNGSAERYRDGGFMSDAKMLQETTGTDISWRAQTWTLAYFQTQWLRRETGGVELMGSGDVVQLRNTLSLDIENARLYLRGNAYAVGRLAGGGEAVVVNLSTPIPQDYSFYRMVDEAKPDVSGNPQAVHEWATEIHHPFSDQDPLLAWSEHQGVVVGTVVPSQEPENLSGVSPKVERLTVLRVPVQRISDSMEETRFNEDEL